MTLLSREQILETDDRKYEIVSCPEWGGDVRLRSITGAQRDSYEQSVMQGSGPDRKLNLRHARAKLIVLCAVGADGRAMFTADDLTALSRKNASPINRLFDVCRALAGMSEEDVDKLTEDFGATPDDDATSD